MVADELLDLRARAAAEHLRQRLTAAGALPDASGKGPMGAEPLTADDTGSSSVPGAMKAKAVEVAAEHASLGPPAEREESRMERRRRMLSRVVLGEGA